MGHKSTVHEEKVKKHSNRDGVQKALEDRVKEMACEGEHYYKIRRSRKCYDRMKSSGILSRVAW